MDLQNKSVVVTGGAKGIGRALVERLCALQARVAALDIDADGLSALGADFPEVSTIICDVTRPDDVEAAVDAIDATAGRIDVLVNNAAVLHNYPLVSFGPGGIRKHPIDIWDQEIATNLSSVFHMTANTVSKMLAKRTKGVIVNVSSIGASGNAGQSAYSAAKAGVRALTVTWAAELGPMGIRVAGIAPGITNTSTAVESMSDTLLKGWVRRTPLRRIAAVAEMVDGIVFIIENDFYCGRTLEIDGGLRW